MNRQAGGQRSYRAVIQPPKLLQLQVGRDEASVTRCCFWDWMAGGEERCVLKIATQARSTPEDLEMDGYGSKRGGDLPWLLIG